MFLHYKLLIPVNYYYRSYDIRASINFINKYLFDSSDLNYRKVYTVKMLLDKLIDIYCVLSLIIKNSEKFTYKDEDIYDTIEFVKYFIRIYHINKDRLQLNTDSPLIELYLSTENL